MTDVTVVGGGLAGCEAAWQLAERGHTVRLVDMRPKSPWQRDWRNSPGPLPSRVTVSMYDPSGLYALTSRAIRSSP